MARELILLCMMAFSLSACAPPGLQARIEQALGHLDATTPGAVVLVTQDGRIVARHAVGMANLEHGAPITLDTVFHVASDAKRFTAASVCRLVERGRLRFDDRVASYLPRMTGPGDRITIEQLLNHTSGLRDQWSLLAMAGWQPEDLVTHDQAIFLISRQESTNFPPGERQMYSNSGYTLLAEIVARVAGEPFDEFVRREFFEPSRMSRTRFRSSVGEIVPDRAESYVLDDSGSYRRRPVQYQVLGPTALLTTAVDLARWVEAVHDGTALSHFELEAMLRPRALPDGEPMTHAFGLHEHDFHGRKAVGHGGADGGFRSYFLRVPAEKLGVIVLANTPSVEPNGLAHEIAEWVLGIEETPDETAPEKEADLELSDLVGSYRDDKGQILTVRRWFDRLRLWEGDERTDFSWSADDRLFRDPLERTLSFDGDRCRLSAASGVWVGDRVDDPTPAALAELLGNYRSQELDAIYTISLEDDRLVVHSIRGARFELTPGGQDFFDGSAWFANEVRFVRSADGRVRGMLLSSSRAFDLYFGRE